MKRDLEVGTIPYPVSFKISVGSAAIANQPTTVWPNRTYELRSMWIERHSGTHLIIINVSLTHGRYSGDMAKYLADIIEKEQRRNRRRKEGRRKTVNITTL